MSEAARIVSQMKSAFSGPAWHGPSLMETLAGITAKDATARAIAGAHTIWEIVLHVCAWDRVVQRRIQGEAASEPAEGDWPKVADQSEESWKTLLSELERRNLQLREAISLLPDSRLEENAPESKTTLYTLLHGEIQHILYHAGQTAVLKKAFSKG